MKNLTEQFKRKRKFLLVLPLLALPFITMIFWALGGGKTETASAQTKQGLNQELPEAKLSSGTLDKMSLYNQATKDSLALREQMKSDPYAKQDTGLFNNNDSFRSAINPGGAYSGSGYSDPNETKVKNKLAQLDQALSNTNYEAAGRNNSNWNDSEQELKLQQLQNAMQSTGQSTDTDMAQLNGMLEKLMDIQNPARAQEKLRQQSIKNKGRVYSVTKYEEDNSSELLAGKTAPSLQQFSPVSSANNFYDLTEPIAAEDTMMQTAIPAVVNETQTLVSGATVKMRLSEDIFINGVKIPSGTFLSGNCSVDGERLKIEVSGIRYGKNLFPVALSVYDLDAIEGVRIPGAISRDASKEGADRALQSVQFMSLDPSIGAQAAGAGVEVAKGLFSKKVKLIRVTVKAGHPLLLMDTKARQSMN